MKKQKAVPGGVVKINLEGNIHSYGRILNYGDLAFYDFRTDVDISDLNSITKSPILFKGLVNVAGVKLGRWPIIGLVPLEKELQNSKYYLEEIGNPDLYKIIHNGVVKFGIAREECIGLEAGVIWSPEIIEDRLRDHYAGRENVYAKMYDVLNR